MAHTAYASRTAGCYLLLQQPCQDASQPEHSPAHGTFWQCRLQLPLLQRVAEPSQHSSLVIAAYIVEQTLLVTVRPFVRFMFNERGPIYVVHVVHVLLPQDSDSL